MHNILLFGKQEDKLRKHKSAYSTLKKKTYEKNNPGNNEMIYLQSMMGKHVEVVGDSNPSLSIKKGCDCIEVEVRDDDQIQVTLSIF